MLFELLSPRLLLLSLLKYLTDRYSYLIHLLNLPLQNNIKSSYKQKLKNTNLRGQNISLLIFLIFRFFPYSFSIHQKNKSIVSLKQLRRLNVKFYTLFYTIIGIICLFLIININDVISICFGLLGTFFILIHGLVNLFLWIDNKNNKKFNKENN